MDWSMAHWHDGDLRCEVFLFDDNPQFRVTLPDADRARMSTDQYYRWLGTWLDGCIQALQAADDNDDTGIDDIPSSGYQLRLCEDIRREVQMLRDRCRFCQRIRVVGGNRR